MKILIHTLNYAPELTGIGKYNGEMGEWLAARGHDVKVVTAPPFFPEWRVAQGYSAWRYRRERIAGVEVWRCPLWVPAKPSGAKRLLHLASFAASSFLAMLGQVWWRPDVVMVTEPPLICVPQSWLTARLSGAKVWLHILDFEVDISLSLAMLRGWRGAQRLLYGLEHLVMRPVDRVSTISEKMVQRVVKKGVPKVRAQLFPNWADTDFVRPLHHDNEVRREFGVGPDEALVLYAGTMGEKQGLDLVLDAADRLKERSDITFVMVGAGPARDRLRRVAIDRKLHNVRFFPVQPAERLPIMLAAGDIHLVVQRREAADLVMPSKLTNILAAGRPSIATVDPGTAVYKVLNDYGCGIATPPENVTEFVRGIIALVEGKELRDRLGNNARQYAESNLNKEKVLSAFEGELQEMIE